MSKFDFSKFWYAELPLANLVEYELLLYQLVVKDNVRLNSRHDVQVSFAETCCANADIRLYLELLSVAVLPLSVLDNEWPVVCYPSSNRCLFTKVLISKRIAMVKHNLKLSFRLFARNRFYAVTSIVGLSFGLTIAILISLYVRFELSFESYNPLSERIVRVTMDYLNGDVVIDQDAEVYRPAGPRILAEFKGVEDFARALPVTNTTIKAGDQAFREDGILAVDPSFLTMFNCTMMAGTKEVLTQPYEVLLSESSAIKYFGTTDVLGQSIQLSRFDQPFKVTGLIANPPANTHIKYNVLISQATYDKKLGKDGLNWDNNNEYTYLLLSDPSQYAAFVAQLNTLNNTLHAEGKIPNERIVAQPLREIHLYSHKSFELEQNGDAFAVYFLMGIAILVLAIAIVNHINLSTAKSLERAKEVGVRKVIGSS
jgi:putative ABC transport system permease protein